MPVPPPSFRRSLDEFVFINKNCLHRINAKRVLSIYSCCFASVGKHRIRKSSIVFQCNKVKRFLLLFSCLFFHSFSRQFKENQKKNNTADSTAFLLFTVGISKSNSFSGLNDIMVRQSSNQLQSDQAFCRYRKYA